MSDEPEVYDLQGCVVMKASETTSLIRECQQASDRILEKQVEIERLNQMLRDTGYGQGQIDAYVAQCEEIERLRARIRLIAALTDTGSPEFRERFGPCCKTVVDNKGVTRTSSGQPAGWRVVEAIREVALDAGANQ